MLLLFVEGRQEKEPPLKSSLISNEVRVTSLKCFRGLECVALGLVAQASKASIHDIEGSSFTKFTISAPGFIFPIPKPKRSISAMEEEELGGGITPAHGAQYSVEHIGSLCSIIIQAQLTRTLH